MLDDKRLAEIEALSQHGQGSHIVRELIAEVRRLREALKDVVDEVGPCNDDERARGRCAGHPMLTRLPCVFGEARKLLS